MEQGIIGGSGEVSGTKEIAMSRKQISEKLRMAEGSSVLVLNGPDEYQRIIGSIPKDVRITRTPEAEVDFVHLFAFNKAELDEYIDLALKAIKYDGLLWVSYPKGSSNIETDINRDRIWEVLKAKEIRPVTQISINDTWSAIRFRPEERVGK
jgi:hypothetical protein